LVVLFEFHFNFRPEQGSMLWWVMMTIYFSIYFRRKYLNNHNIGLFAHLLWAQL
jgi:hypothetical protein